MNRIQDAKAFGYEMAFRNKMAEMWIDFTHMLGVEPESAKLRTSEKEERLKEMLAFIHQEYGNEISLSDIAGEQKRSTSMFSGRNPYFAGRLPQRIPSADGMRYVEKHF